METVNHVRLFSTWNITNMAEELNFFILFNFQYFKYK